jgi:hypothetical protein
VLIAQENPFSHSSVPYGQTGKKQMNKKEKEKKERKKERKKQVHFCNF